MMQQTWLGIFRRAGISLVLMVLLLSIAVPLTASTSTAPAATPVRVVDTYGNLPLHFEANQGQTDSQVTFLARGRGYTLFLTPTEAVLALRQSQTARPSPRAGRLARAAATEDRQVKGHAVLRLQLLGANPQPQITGLEELPGKVNYFIGNDPTQWRTNIPTYAKAIYQEVYPGIDLVYYGKQRQVEFDFVVAPGTDPTLITLGFEGADSLEVDAHGNVVLRVAGGELRLHKPMVYQEVEGVRQEIAGGYVRKDVRQVGFQVAAYDASQPLIIDPVLFYSTYLGGSNIDEGLGIAVDAAGNAYVTGATDSSDFPTTAGAFQTSLGGAFVTKLNPTGSGLVYSTYLGGSISDVGFGIAVDAAGNAYVTGSTSSTNFPTTAGAFQTSLGGRGDAFVTKLNPTGSGLVYSTYLGGSSGDSGRGIAVDAAGNAYVTGFTDSSDFPTTPGAFQTTLGGGTDAFVAKLNPLGSALVYSTYLGGSASDFGASIAVDAIGNAYVTGRTPSSDFPTTPGAVQTALGGRGDAFVTKLNPLGSALVYSTYLGGSGPDEGFGIAVDSLPNPNAYVTGHTRSSDFPTTAGAFQTSSLGGFSDAFIAKILDVVLPPPPTEAKVTGGGSVPVSGGIGTFGFIVQRQAADGSIHGDLQYVNHASRARVHSVMFTSFVVTGNTARFEGTCTNNGAACIFTVDVTDNGEPGKNDRFTISVSAGPAEGGTLRGGNIQIHE